MDKSKILGVQDWETSAAPTSQKQVKEEHMQRLERDMTPTSLAKKKNIKFAPPSPEEMKGKDSFGNPIIEDQSKQQELEYTEKIKLLIRKNKPKYTFLEELDLTIPLFCVGSLIISYNDTKELTSFAFCGWTDLTEKLLKMPTYE